MAKILFGVMGDALGHVNQALAVAAEMPEHEHIFVGGGQALALEKKGYRVEPVPVPGTYYRNNCVDVSATMRNAMRITALKRKIVSRIIRLIREYQPDIVLSAYEYFSPLAAKKTGKPCISVDNQHAFTKCVRPFRPAPHPISRLMYELPLRFMYSKADYYIVNAFYRLRPKKHSETKVFPPLLSPLVKNFVPHDGEHVLVYQTSPTFKQLISILSRWPNRYIIYGSHPQGNSENLVFKKPSGEGFLKDLAGCRYFITNGGHNGISEALYYGKPVLSFPIRLAYEQYFNARMLAVMGYGACDTTAHPSLEVFRRFEENLERYKKRIDAGEFWGNGKIGRWLKNFIRGLKNGTSRQS